MVGVMYGIGKLTEESGELTEALAAWVLARQLGRIQQLLGKAIAMPVGDHWDGEGPIRARLQNELADARAILLYFCKENFTADENLEMQARVDHKLDRFMKWGLTGIPETPINPRNE